MTKQLREGFYRLVESRDNNKILFLDKDTFAWINARNIGEILVKSYKTPKIKIHINEGRFRLFLVKDEPMLHDIEHLELEYSKDNRQGYFLLTGLPGDDKKRARIIPTDEIISNKIAEVENVD